MSMRGPGGRKPPDRQAAEERERASGLMMMALLDGREPLTVANLAVGARVDSSTGYRQLQTVRGGSHLQARTQLGQFSQVYGPSAAAEAPPAELSPDDLAYYERLYRHSSDADVREFLSGNHTFLRRRG